MKPFLKGILAVCCSLAVISALLAGCRKPVQQESTDEKSLYDHGLEMVSLLAEMAASEEYVDSFSSSDSIKSLLQKTGSGNFAGLDWVYRVKVSDAALMRQTDIVLDNLSPSLRDNLKSRLNAAVVTQINAMGGAEVLAAASICTVKKTFVSTELDEDIIYIYTFHHADPVAVTLTKGENNTVSATGSFLFNDSFREDPESFLTDMFTLYGVRIEMIAP